MKLINQSVEYLPQEDLFKQIERAARVCYKSENNSTGDSKSFVDKLIKMKHFSMLEQGTIYLKMFWSGSVCDLCNQTKEDKHIDKYLINPYSKVVYHGNDVYITTNYRVLVENSWLEDLKYQCKPTEYHIKRYTFRLTTSISIVRELIRHRAFSFANESTRYCNYSKDRFDNELTFIIPHWLKISPIHIEPNVYSSTFESVKKLLNMNIKDINALEFLPTLLLTEHAYKHMQLGSKSGTPLGLSPQQAREVLPLCTKSELIMTGFEDDWKRFLDVRLEGTTGKPHPDMVELAKMIKDKLDKIKDNGS